MTYGILWGLAVTLTVASAGLAVILAADPVSLGITPVVKTWLGVVAAMIGVALGLLPRVTKPPDPKREGMD